MLGIAVNSMWSEFFYFFYKFNVINLSIFGKKIIQSKAPSPIPPLANNDTGSHNFFFFDKSRITYLAFMNHDYEPLHIVV